VTVFFSNLFIDGVCEPELYGKDKRQLMIIITMPESAYSAIVVLNHQGLGSGDQSKNQVFTQRQSSMEKRRKKAVEEMTILPSNNVGGQVRQEYLVHIFDRDMHRDFNQSNIIYFNCACAMLIFLNQNKQNSSHITPLRELGRDQFSQLHFLRPGIQIVYRSLIL
jgi:hypothetical protein